MNQLKLPETADLWEGFGECGKNLIRDKGGAIVDNVRTVFSSDTHALCLRFYIASLTIADSVGGLVIE